MDVWRITVALLRRWYVFLPLLVVSGLGAFAVGEGVQPQYEVTATAVLVPGTVESEIDNPYGSMEGTTDVLSIVLDGPSKRDAIEARGLNPDYEVDTRSQSSIMDVTVLSDTRQESLATAGEVLEMARQELAERQEAVGIPTDARIRLQVLRAPTLSEVVTEGKTRNMAVVGVAGAALSLLVTLLFDDLVGILKRWVHRRKERRAAPDEEPQENAHDERRETVASDEPTPPVDSRSRPPADDGASPQQDSATRDGHEAATSRGRA